MRARIYQPARNAMQSGQAKTKLWYLDFLSSEARDIDPLMGWTGSSDTQSQVRLKFDSREAAEHYAKTRGIDYVVTGAHKRAINIRQMGYGENFQSNRRANWTH
ncbi:ETC complex I subunit [Rhodobacter maris]|uniref:ETC complex I subunit-like protein n=1 Tax=Rhodobacter maris TaxID=446682 RepID=A0A285S706_9RHOB|nr:ETC complex I subunit [Rhodobacter maris]SOC02844.1 ETC complex I subunit-like protein [Rhodobacter maris]